MPIEKYFGGHGEKVMAGMKKKYGKRAKNVFYATANKRGLTGSGKFTQSEINQGYKVMARASELHSMDFEHEHMGDMMAKRKMPKHMPMGKMKMGMEY